MKILFAGVVLSMFASGAIADPNKIYCMQALKAASQAFRGVDRVESIRMSTAAAKLERVALDELGNRSMNREEIRASFEGAELFSKDPATMNANERRIYIDKSMRDVSACLKLADALAP